MAVSSVDYRNVLYQWQGQQLKSTGYSGSSSNSSAISSLFNNSTSMTSQIASMVELTKYAMEKMGVSSDSRVTFSQISKYREQLQSEFNQAVKAGLTDSGITDVNALRFSLDKDGAISVIGDNASDRKRAQAWLDANPSYGKDLRAALDATEIDSSIAVEFTISSTGKMTLVDKTTESLQAALDANPDLTSSLREAMETFGISKDTTLDLKFDEDGNLQADGDDDSIKAFNEWLAENPDIATAIKDELAKKNVDISAASLRLGKEGSLQISANNADNNEIQAVLNKQTDMGSKIMTGLGSLGIDPNITFSIQFDENGKVNIISDHPDRDKIQQFFEENPELLKTYQQIETLAGIDDARKAMQLSPSVMRKRIQIESMSAWWASSGNSNNYFGTYNDGNFSLLAGLNLQI